MTISEIELLDALRELAADLGETPTTTQMDDKGEYPTSTYYRHFDSWNDVLETAGLGPNREYGISEEVAKDALQEFAEELGETPTYEQMKEEGPYGTTTYERRFGTWNDALKAAGLEPNEEQPAYGMTDDDLLDALREFADGLDGSPTAPQMEEEGPYGAATYTNRFGSWNGALEEAGLEPNRERSISDKTLLDALTDFADELGETPNADQMREKGPYPESTYRGHFGNWNAALKAAGLEPNEEQPASGMTDDELLDALRVMADELGKTPTSVQMKIEGPYSDGVYKNRFGTWNNALEAAGLELNMEREVPEDELLTELTALADVVDGTPTRRQMKSEGSFSDILYKSHFGSWNNALEAAGLTPHQGASDRSLITSLQEFADEIGQTPTVIQMRKEGPYSANTYSERFGSWNAALEEANLERAIGTSRNESILYGILDAINVSWKKEVHLVSGRQYRVDVLLPSYDIVIEADGVYWHGHPNKFPYDERQIYHIKNDAEKDRMLCQEGYHVVRFWGNSLKNCRKEIEQTIREIVQDERLPEHGKHVFGPEPFADTRAQE